MIVQITNGEVILKDTCTRKLKKEINKALFSNVEYGTDGSLKGFSMSAKDEANDMAVLGMIEKITIAGVEKPVAQDTIDELDTDDFDKIFSKVEEITNKPLPNA